jgi:hypothetical protein
MVTSVIVIAGPLARIRAADIDAYDELRMCGIRQRHRRRERDASVFLTLELSCGAARA